jgi:dTDP-4-amino-4,6-dideoxygalactose transaminase
LTKPSHLFARPVGWLYGKLKIPHSLRKSAKTHLVVQSKAPELPVGSPFYSRELHPYQAALLLRMLPRLDQIREHIARLVSVYQNAFRNSPIQTFLHDSDFDAGGLLRFPIAPGNKRSQVIRLARQRGIYLETNYDEPLPDASEHARFPNSVWAAQNVVLLPLYRSLSVAAAERLARTLIEIDREASCAEAPAPARVSQDDSGRERFAINSVAR